MQRTTLGTITALLFGLLPFITLPNLFYADINAKFFYLILCIDILIFVFAYKLYKGYRTSSRGRLLLFAFLIVGAVKLISTFLGVFPERSLWSDLFWSSGVLFLVHLGCFAFILGELLSEKDWSFVRRAIVFSAGACGLWSILGATGLGFTGKLLFVDFGQGSLAFGNDTYAGVFLLLAFVVGCIEIVHGGYTRRLHYLLLTSLSFVALSPVLINTGLFLGKTSWSDFLANPALILGSARASSATLLLFLIFLAGWYLIRRFSQTGHTGLLLSWGTTLGVGATLGIILLFTPGSVVQEKYIEASTAARIIVWEAGFEAFKEHPIFGWGPENFNYALEHHFDNRLFLDENIGEIWFERAHNVFIDTLVGTGAFGALSLALLIGAYLRVIYLARKQEIISEAEAVLLYSIIPVHLLQLQTGFDTISSYALLSVIGGYTLFLERRLVPTMAPRQQFVEYKVVAAAIAVCALLSLKFILLDEFNRQATLVKTFSGTTLAEQELLINTSLARISSFESLRISSSSFIKGSLGSLAVAPTPEKTKLVLSVAEIYEGKYQQYLEVQPDHYRARMNYAYLLLIETTLGSNRLDEARTIIKDSYGLSPGNPLTFVLDSVAALYSGNIPEADRLMQQALAINPNISFTRETATYLEAQKNSFPSISVLKLENL